MRLVLVRHGAHDLVGVALAGRMPEVALNARGREQAEALGVALAGAELSALYSSPQRRTRETAAAIAHRLHLPVQDAPEFDEIDFGEWTGRTIAELEDAAGGAPGWREWVEHRATATPLGGEPFSKVRQRVLEGAERLRRAHPSGCVAVVSHADVIKALLATHLGMSLNELERLDIACASISAIDMGEGWARVACINCPMLLARA
jgi:probable phosphoglycerate mutase